MATDYSSLYKEYPEIISADQLYRICHISKRKAKWLLDSGYIPCQDSGKKTLRYKIRLEDAIAYLRTLETAPVCEAAMQHKAGGKAMAGGVHLSVHHCESQQTLQHPSPNSKAVFRASIGQAPCKIGLPETLDFPA